MASAGGSGGGLQLDSIPVVDLRLFSLAELYSLSLCSSSAFDPRRCDDVVIPKIDRSVFKESAASRKQTYFRLRLAPPSSSSSAASRRTSTSVAATGDSVYAHDNEENNQIVDLLKQLFVSDMNLTELVPVKIDCSGAKPPDQVPPPALSSPSKLNATGKKRKRNRTTASDVAAKERGGISSRSSVPENEHRLDPGDINLEEDNYGFSYPFDIAVRQKMEDTDRGIVNRDGVDVDTVALGLVQHPYVEEINRMTEGLGTKREFVKFLEGLYGQWASRRKMKKIVNANEFGPALPIDWKLLLTVQKTEGQLRICCSRYISPSGLYFVSCKGVSSYLCCLHGIKDAPAYEPTQHNEIVQDADKLTSTTIAELSIQYDSSSQNLALPPDSDFVSDNHGIEVEVSAPELEPIGAGKVLHCDECDESFDDEDDLLQHHGVVHRRNTRRNGMCIAGAESSADGGAGNLYNLNSSSEFPVRDSLNNEPNGNMRYGDAPFCNENLHECNFQNPSACEMIESPRLLDPEMHGTLVSSGIKNLSHLDESDNGDQPRKHENTAVNGDHIRDEISIADFGDGSVIPTWNKQKRVPKMDGYAALMCELEESERSASKNILEDMRGAESDDFFSACHHGVLNSHQDQKYEVSSDKNVVRKANMNTLVFNEAIEENKDQQSEAVLFGFSSTSNISSHGGYMFDSVYSNPSIQSKQNEAEENRKPDPSLSFGVPQTEEGFNIESSVPDDLKLGISYAFDFMDSSFSNRRQDRQDHGHNFGILQPEGDWKNHGGVSYGQKLIAGSQLSGYKNHLKLPFTAAHHAPSSSTHFHSFGITQVEKDRLGAMRNATQGQMMRQINNEPVEYSFMGEHSTSNIGSHGESSIFSYNNNAREQDQTPFWLRKDGGPTPSANTNTHIGLVASVCVWCRNLFLHEPLGMMQTGSEIGTMCPSCRSRIPGHFNLL